MAACEKCWRDANQRALLLGGSVSDHYRDLLREREAQPCSTTERGEERQAVNAGATTTEQGATESAHTSSSVRETLIPRLEAHAREMELAADSPYQAIMSIYLRQGAGVLREVAASLAVLVQAQAERTRHGGNVGETPFYLQPGQYEPEYDQGHSVVVWYDDLVLKQEDLDKAIKRAEAAEATLADLRSETAREDRQL